MNKAIITNLTATIITIVGYYSPQYSNHIFSAGIFALSGAVTNWLAIHMLFEKVPFLYGSGVIPNRFEDFKTGIKNLIINEFFNKGNIEKFFQNNSAISSDEIAKKVDMDKIFNDLVDAIVDSPLGGMLGMVGGRSALDPLKEPIQIKMKQIIDELIQGNNGDVSSASLLMEKVDAIIDERLKELTPEVVKRIIQDMIRKHLGWLVVWGGVFGGLIGLLVSFL